MSQSARLDKLEERLPAGPQEPPRHIVLTQDLENPELYTYQVRSPGADWREVDYRQGLQDTTGEKLTKPEILARVQPRPDEVVIVIRNEEAKIG